jgi:hypothetical protein
MRGEQELAKGIGVDRFQKKKQKVAGYESGQAGF